jgi:hypothetical protein
LRKQKIAHEYCDSVIPTLVYGFLPTSGGGSIDYIIVYEARCMDELGQYGKDNVQPTELRIFFVSRFGTQEGNCNADAFTACLENLASQLRYERVVIDEICF